jgi:hypothetical protein
MFESCGTAGGGAMSRVPEFVLPGVRNGTRRPAHLRRVPSKTTPGNGAANRVDPAFRGSPVGGGGALRVMAFVLHSGMVAGRFDSAQAVGKGGAALKSEVTTEHSGIELLEEAVALARRAPARAWSWYLAGAVPFFAAFLFYVRATSGVLAVPDPSAASLALAVLFGWRQLSRSVFGRILAEDVFPGMRTVPTRRVWVRAAARTWFAGLLRVILILLPTPYLSALFRNYQAYAWEDGNAFRRAAAMAGRGGNPLVSWLTLGAVSFFVWVNIFSGIMLGPVLYRIFTGEEGGLTRDIGAMLNKTVTLASLFVAWCLCDAVMEAMYVLRRFYGESEQTGADLLQAFRRALGNATVGGLAAICLAAGLQAQTPPDTNQVRLNKAINDVLAENQYQWREPPLQSDAGSPLVRWMRGVVDSVTRFVHAALRPVRRLWDAFWRWVRSLFESGEPTGPKAPVSALRITSVLLLVVLAGVLVALLLGARARGRKSPTTGVAVPVPFDLADPGLAATDLPEEQWLALAREWMQKGDPRMALRAWFLGSLALLNARELVSISRYKSNLDYKRELARRARGIAGLEREFALSVRSFETAWYGLYPIDAAEVENFAAGFERMRSLCR